MKKFLAFAASMIAAIMMPAEMTPPFYNGSISPAPQQINSQFVNIPVDHNSVSISIGSNPTKSAPIAMSLLQQRLENLKHSNPEKVNIILGLISDPEFKDINLDSGKIQNKPEAYIIKVDHNPGQTTNIYAAGSDNRGVFYAAMTILQLIDQENSTLNIADIVDFPIWQKRFMTDYFLPRKESFPKTFAMWKINGYAWQTAASWHDLDLNTEPVYGSFATTKEALEDFKSFYEQSGGLVDLMLAPRLYGYKDVERFDAANEEHIRQLIEYCRTAAEYHVSHIMLRVDDVLPQIEGKYQFASENEAKKFNSPGEAHGYIMRRLYDALHPEFPDLQLSFCPGPYTIDSHRAEQDPAKTYLHDLAAAMPEEVYIVWTGRDVCTPVITREDTLRYLNLINNHKLYTWHNPDLITNILACPDNLDFYPGYDQVGDSIFFANSEGTGKYRNRPSDLTYNDYLWNPNAYRGSDTYIKNMALQTGVKNTAGYKNMLQMLRDLKKCEDKQLKLKIIANIRELAAEFDDKLDQAWLHQLLEREYANASTPTTTILVPSGPLNIVPDGEFNEEIWQYHAEKFTLNNIDGNRPDEQFRTSGMIYYNRSADTVFLAIECKNPSPETAVQLPRDSRDIMKNDSILMSFIPVEERQCDIAFDSAGNRYDQYHWVLDWDPEWQLAVKNNRDGWCAEAAIPIDAFRQATMPEDDEINPGTAWYFQIVRNIPGSEQLYLSTPTRNDTRDMGRYAKLIFQ